MNVLLKYDIFGIIIRADDSFSGVIVELALITLTMLMSKKPFSFPNNYVGGTSWKARYKRI